MSSRLVADLLLDRRSALKSAVGLSLGAVLGTAAAPPARAGTALNYADPADNLYAFGKLWAGYDTPVIGAFHGLMYLRIPGRRAVPVFGHTGTGDILETWANPFTGKTVPVYYFYNDVLVGKVGKEIPRFFMGVEGDSPTLMNEGTAFPDTAGRYPFILPFQTYGDDMLLSWDYTHDYTNPVTPAGWPRSSTGKRTTPSEHFTFNFSKREMEDRDLPTVRFNAGFTPLSECCPFMQMGGTEYAGATLFGRMFSHKGLQGLDDVPPEAAGYPWKRRPSRCPPVAAAARRSALRRDPSPFPCV